MSKFDSFQKTGSKSRNVWDGDASRVRKNRRCGSMWSPLITAVPSAQVRSWDTRLSKQRRIKIVMVCF